MFSAIRPMATVLLFVLTSLCVAQVEQRYQPRAPIYLPEVQEFDRDEAEISSNNEELVDQLVGIVFLENADQVDQNPVAATGVQVLGGPRLDLLRSQELQNTVAPYFGRPVSLRSLDELTRDIIRLYRRNNRPVLDVVVPEQDITNGTLQLLVIEAKVGKVLVEGPCYFDACKMARDTCTRSGDHYIYESRLMEDLRWLNQNRYRDVEVRLRPGANQGETDIVFEVQDKLPLTLYAGYEDSGTRPLGIERTIYGLNWGNALRRGDNFGYQFTASPDYNTLLAHSGSYTTWFDNRNSLSIFGTYAEINADIAGAVLDGTAWQVSTRYDKEIYPGYCCPRTCYEHHLVAGFDFKNTTTDLDFGGTSVFSSPAEIVQLVFGYNGFCGRGVNSANWYANVYVGLDGITTFNDDASFDAFRTGTNTDYVYARAFYQRQRTILGNWRLATRVTGQLASDRLQPSEQLGMAGFNAVRGYDMREVVGDTGYFTNVELRTPPISFGCNLRERSELQFLGFYDRAAAHTISAIAPEDANVNIASVGAGVRYRLGQSVSLRADYGRQLESLPNSERSARFHVGATVFR